MWEFLTGLFFASVYSWCVHPREVGGVPKTSVTVYPVLWKGMVIVPWGERAVHVHHWVICLVLLMVVSMSPVVRGVVVGMLVQGLMYGDRFEFVCENPYGGGLVYGG